MVSVLFLRETDLSGVLVLYFEVSIVLGLELKLVFPLILGHLLVELLNLIVVFLLDLLSPLLSVLGMQFLDS